MSYKIIITDTETNVQVAVAEYPVIVYESANVSIGGNTYVLPVASANAIGGVKANNGTDGQFVTGINTVDGSLTYATPPTGNSYVLPTASANTIGGVKANGGNVGQFVTGINTVDGSLTYATPPTGNVQSVTAGFGINIANNAGNVVISTAATSVDYANMSNRALLDTVTVSSGYYRTMADANNPANNGIEDWLVHVIEGDAGQGSVQYWSRCSGVSKLFIRSVDTNSTYGSFTEITNQGSTYTLPTASANAIGGVKANNGTAGQFVTGINTVDGSLTYATPPTGNSLVFSQRNPRELFSASAVNNGDTTVTFGVDVTRLYTVGYKFAFTSRPTSLYFSVTSATFTNGVSTVTFSPAANDTYPVGTQMWEITQNTPVTLAEGEGIEFDEEGTLTVISVNPATASTLGGIRTGSPTTGQFVQGFNADGSAKYAIPSGTYTLPVATANALGGVRSNDGTAGQFVKGINAADGSLQFASPPVYTLPVASANTIGGVKANSGTAGQFVTGINTVDGSLTFATPSGGGVGNAIFQGSYNYGGNVSAINSSGNFALGGNGETALTLSVQNLWSAPITVPTTSAPIGLQIGAHVVQNGQAIAIVTSGSVKFVNNVTTPTQSITSPTAVTMFGSGYSIVSSKIDEDGYVWVIAGLSGGNYKIGRIAFTNFTTTPTAMVSANFTWYGVSASSMATLNQFGISANSARTSYSIVLTGSSSTPSDGHYVYSASVTVAGGSITAVSTPSTSLPSIGSTLYAVDISAIYGLYVASFSGGTVYQYDSGKNNWVLRYTLSPADQSSQLVIDRSNGNVWLAYDTDALIRITPSGTVTKFAAPSELSYTDIDQGQNTWGLFLPPSTANDGSTATVITYASVNNIAANYMLTAGSDTVTMVSGDLQLSGAIIDGNGSSGLANQLLTVGANGNTVWTTPPITKGVYTYRLYTQPPTAAQVTVPFDYAPEIASGTMFGSMNAGVFTASRNVLLRVSISYNLQLNAVATPDAWGTINGAWTTGVRYAQLSDNGTNAIEKGSVTQILKLNAGDTFAYRANNVVTWTPGTNGTAIEFEEL